DFNNAFLVILATNNRKQNKTWAKQLSPHRLVCVVDEAGEGNVIFPAAVQRGQLQIAITTNGASPKLARSLKHDLESW
ncbi:NAD(P)-dependent oxidoreductase, partial [Alkalihalophilus lindianensis]